MSSSEEEEIEPAQFNLGDQWAMKHCLDEEAIKVINDEGYDTDWKMWNTKMAISFLSCVAAGVAVSSDWVLGEYPKNKDVLMVCVCIYWGSGVVLQLIASFIEGGYLTFTLGNEEKNIPALTISSVMERYDDRYRLIIEPRDQMDKNRMPVVDFEDSITKWFDTDGYMAPTLFAEVVTKLLKRYEAKARRYGVQGNSGASAADR